MPHSSLVESHLRPPVPVGWQAAFLSAGASASERINAVATALGSPAGTLLRKEMGKWIVRHLPVEELVPERYAQWRPLVRDAMLFMVQHLSDARLAPKLVEQIDLPPDTPTEIRLLRLIAKVPGLQKLGQVLARNRHLLSSLRDALSELENGISDMDADVVCAIIRKELGPQLQAFSVRVEPAIFSEASVSAVVRFTWKNPGSRRRERGVFKVMKPYIPACFAEDMHLLARLATHLSSNHRAYGFARRVLPDTFNDVRRLLQHEVDFVREQATLLEASRLYGSVPDVRVPRLIQPLCTPKITAMTEERGKKITDAVAGMPAWRRAHVSEQLIEALVAVPMFASERDVMFHADPHAGNLLYDKRTGNLVILDWALTERISRAQRRHLALLFLMTALRDPAGLRTEIRALGRRGGRRNGQRARVIAESVTRFIDQLPLTRIPGAVDAMGLLEDVAFQGVRLPAPLIMLRKALFTLDGIQRDIGGDDVGMASVILRHGIQRWMVKRSNFGFPLSLRDWLVVQTSMLLCGSRLWWQGMQAALDRSRSRGQRASVVAQISSVEH